MNHNSQSGLTSTGDTAFYTTFQYIFNSVNIISLALLEVEQTASIPLISVTIAVVSIL